MKAIDQRHTLEVGDEKGQKGINYVQKKFHSEAETQKPTRITPTEPAKTLTATSNWPSEVAKMQKRAEKM